MDKTEQGGPVIFQSGPAVTAEKCERCGHRVDVLPVVMHGVGFVAVTWACPHRLDRPDGGSQRCGQPTAMVGVGDRTRYLFRKTFDELTKLLVLLHGNVVHLKENPAT